MNLLLAIKRLICALGFGSRLVEFCQSCGRTVQQTWRSSDELWLEATGKPEVGVRCIPCFDKAHYANGKILRWVPHVAHIRIGGRWI